MVVAKLRQRGGANEGGVSGQDQDMVIAREGFAAHHDGVAGSALFRLENKSDSVVGHRFLHALGLVADDDVDIARGDDLQGRIQHMLQEGLAADLMQNLGKLRLQARAFSRGENGDGEPRRRTLARGRRGLPGLTALRFHVLP